MVKKETGYVIPEPSTAFYSEVRQEFEGSELTIKFDYDKDGKIYRSGLRFIGTRCFRFHSEIHCSAWQIEDAFDTLTEIVDSTWINKVREITPVDLIEKSEMHHYMIFMDSTGCFEIIAKHWEEITEEAGSWKDSLKV